MSAFSDQDSSFVTKIRQSATSLLSVADKALGAQEEWDSCFGGISRLTDFNGTNDGIVKADVEAALTVLEALNTWLDEAGQNRRLNLQKIRNAN